MDSQSLLVNLVGISEEAMEESSQVSAFPSRSQLLIYYRFRRSRCSHCVDFGIRLWMSGGSCKLVSEYIIGKYRTKECRVHQIYMALYIYLCDANHLYLTLKDLLHEWEGFSFGNHQYSIERNIIKSLWYCVCVCWVTPLYCGGSSLA